MDSSIALDLPPIFRLIVALAIVLLLMGGLAWLVKKLGLSAMPTIKQGEKKRLALVESLPLDARRRMVIVKCDEVEHLVILGAQGETVVAADITGDKPSAT